MTIRLKTESFRVLSATSLSVVLVCNINGCMGHSCSRSS